MLKNWKKKLIAMILIFTLTFGNFALVGKTYAASIFNGIFSNEDVGDTGSSNVEFETYFYDDQNADTVSIKSDVKNESLKIAVKVAVKNSGYLKDAKILFGNGEALNFEIDSENQEEVEGVQSFENNELDLIQLEAGTEVTVAFPISYVSQKYVNSDNVSKLNTVRFEGNYVNDKAEEIEVSKDVDLKLSWTDEREVTVSSDVTKYIGYSVDGVSGIILQTLITADNQTDNKTLPVKNSEVQIQVPVLDGVLPKTVNVVASSTAGTNGKESDSVLFGTDNWNYDEETNNLTIKVNNQSELVSTQNENDILIDETAPLEERYLNASGSDEYLVTYTYENVEMTERTISSNIVATYNMFGGTSLKTENQMNYDVSSQIGDIVTFSLDTLTKSISKGYTYLNYNNDENKYEIEIDNTITFNVSYKDIVDGLYYKDTGNNYISKDNEVFAQDDIYYKTIKISKENFDLMLGEDGYINIVSEDGNVLFTVNKDVEVTEDGYYELTLDNSIKSLQISTSKPISDGNLVISVLKAYSNVSFDKENYKNFDKIEINAVGKAKYIYLDEMADCGVSNLEIGLDDTKTEATLEIGQDTLSTLAMNNNVEMKIELNNETVDSDVYGNSEFTIKMPEYVETVEVTDASLVYGEGMELTNVEAYEQDGNIYLKVNTEGEQNALSSGIISNGTNIVLNTNVKVDLFAPATDGKFELTYTNSEATNYEAEAEEGFDEEIISYSAPVGVVSVNSTSGYNLSGSTLTSVNQGKVTDEILIYSDSKTATMELTIMNNESNDISNVSILGRVPYEGIKDILTGDDLGTTVTVKMLSGLVADSSNDAKFTVYYSENGEATNDLNNSSNGWMVSPSSFENVKSYLIIPDDSGYVMRSATKLRFTYTYEIPENLEHNEEIYGTFATYYTNNTKVADVNEISEADIIGLVTGEGPQFDVETKVDKTSINEFEDLNITVTVTNTGKMKAKDVAINIPIPEYTSYANIETSNSDTKWEIDGNNVNFTLDELNVEETATFTLTVNADEVYSINDDVLATRVYANVTATDLGTTIESEAEQVTITQAELQVTLDSNVYETAIDDDTEIKLYVRVKNLKSEPIKNTEVTMKLDDNFEYVSSYILGFAEDGISVVENEEGSYDASSKTVTWKISNIDSLEVASLRLYLKARAIEGNSTKTETSLVATAKADSTESYTSGAINFTVGKPNLVVNQTTTTTNTYVKEGETINYQFTIKNEGSVKAKSVILKDSLPTGLVAKSISYEVDGIVTNKAISSKDKVSIGTAIDVGDTVTVNIEATATSLKGSQELSVTNSGTVTSGNAETVKSNEITHIIESSKTNVTNTTTGESSTGVASSSTTGTLSSLSKTYKITGIAWLDSDNDGMRSDSEALMSGVTATLVDSDGGIIKQSVVTNSKGEYTFTGVSNGNYIIIFDYNTVLYTVTVYQKENVTSNVNSDVITTKIEQDGVLRNGAVTDVITVADGSVSNIDIGLVEAMKFDLNLDLGITKITVQNSSGTNTENYDSAKLTKTEISAKQMAGSTVYIEYTFKVKNEGEISGYANKIVDYIPADMTFNSGMNADWYTGSDGNLYTTALSNVEIQPGETKTFTLVLSRTMTNDNTGTVSNTAEITEDYNIYGVSDLDSTPGNKAQAEDDFSRADSYLSVRTGEEFVYVSVIITTILLIGIAAFIVVLKLKYKLAKGGV